MYVYFLTSPGECACWKLSEEASWIFRRLLMDGPAVSANLSFLGEQAFYCAAIVDGWMELINPRVVSIAS